MMGRLGDIDSTVKRTSSGCTLSSVQNDSTYVFMDIEIDRGCQTCSANMCSNPSDIPLYKYNEVPDFLQGNPYLTNGYRAFLPPSLCFKSLFVWSNETINIWSHLFGFMLFSFLCLYDNIVLIPQHNGTWSDHMVVTGGLVCYQFCMLCSVGYHMFNCHSEKASKRWLGTDLAGISVGLIGCYLPSVHYAFYCLSVWRDVYLLTVILLSVAVLFTQLHPRYFSPHWWHRRLFLYCGLAAYGIIPAIHWIYLNGGWGEKLVQIFMPKVIIMYFLGCLAFAFYISKFPERCFPGSVDYIGSSHQWWHVIVVFAFFYWHNAGQEFLQYRAHEDTCVALSRQG